MNISFEKIFFEDIVYKYNYDYYLKLNIYFFFKIWFVFFSYIIHFYI